VVKEELYIGNERVELLGSLEPNLTFNISDIKNPDKRKSDYSKSISLPGSKKINKLFEHIFEVNIDLQTFNPNLKTDVLYLVNGETIIDGYLQLKEIKIIDELISYEVTIIGRVGNFINELGNKELTDLDMSSLNHTYDKATQVATWNYPLTTDYVYPMINYDINYGGQGFSEQWDVEDLFPAITAKKYIDEIFADAGYTYDSDFFDSQYFENLIIPFSSKNFALTETVINNRIFNANTPEIQATGVPELYALEYNDNTSYDDDIINNIVEVYDTSNIHSIVTGIYTPNQNGFYNIEAMLQLQGEFTAPSTPAASYTLLGYIQGYIEINKYTSGGVFINTLDQVSFGVSKYNASVAPSATVTTLAAPTTPSQDYIYMAITGGSNTTDITSLGNNNNSICNKYNINVSNIYLSANEQIKLEIKYAVRKETAFGYSYGSPCWYVSAGVLRNGPVNGYKLNILDGYFKNSVVNSGYTDGNTIDMSSSIPLKVKQRDYFMSLVKMFNLYVQSDGQNDKNLLIEPRDDFFTNDIVDWTQKLDNSKEVTYLPMGALDSKDYLYTYKQDKDYYNKLYEETWSEIYGQRKYGITNDFIKNEFKTEIIFSPTPSVGQAWYDRVIPTIIKYDDKNGVQRTESNIRILQWSGLKNTQQCWDYTDNSGVFDLRTTYPYAGMYNDPYTPTEDIGFGLTREIYWADVFNNSITISNNNLFNKYHKKFIEEITDVNSKIVRGYFRLTPSDIKNISFRKQFRFNNAYFRLNKIENYNPSELTMCEFLKIKDAEIFVPTDTLINGAVDIKIGAEASPTFSQASARLHNGNSQGNRNHTVSGDNNYISRSATNVDIKGNSNKVYSNALNVTIQGDDNVIKSGVSNVNLINTNGLIISQSNTTVVNNSILGSGSLIEVSTSPYTATEEILTYLVDTSGGNIELYLPDTTEIGQTFDIKLIEASNTLNITTASGTPRIDGAANKATSNLYDSFSIRFDGVDYQIISKN